MNHDRFLAASAAFTLLAAAVPAQLQKGGKPPAFAFEKTWNDAPASFADLEGKLVILDFSQTW